jgi:hypothetical protein
MEVDFEVGRSDSAERGTLFFNEGIPGLFTGTAGCNAAELE